MRLVLDRNSLEIEVYMEGDSLPAFWLYPYEPGEEVGEDEEVMEAPDWVAEEVGEDYLPLPRPTLPGAGACGPGLPSRDLHRCLWGDLPHLQGDSLPLLGVGQLALDLEAPPGPPGGVLADPDSGCRDGGVR